MPKFFSLTEENMFAAQIGFALCGAYLTNYYEEISHYYWLSLMILSAAAALAPDFSGMQQQSAESTRRFTQHVLYWAGSLFAAIIVYALHRDGRLDIHETGLIILLILAMSTYYDGVIKASKRTAFSGFYLGLIVLSTAFPDTYLGPLCMLAVLAITCSHYRQFSNQIHSIRME